MENELKKMAMHNRKKQKGLPRKQFFKYNAGNVEEGNKIFNASTTGDAPEVNPMSGGPLGEEMENRKIYRDGDEAILHYDNLEVEKIVDLKKEPEINAIGEDRIYDTVDYDYHEDYDFVAEVLADELTEEDMPNLDTASDPEIWGFVDDHFDELAKKYEKKLLDYFRESAAIHWEENEAYDEYDKDSPFEESVDDRFYKDTCYHCGRQLNDAGECPYCDLGDEDVVYDEMSNTDALYELNKIDKVEK